VLVLDDTNDETSGVEAISEKEEGSKVGECVSVN